MKIVVLGGGLSTERAVSLVTANSVCRALRERGHQAVFVDLYFGLENYAGTPEQAFDEPDGLVVDLSIGSEAPDLAAVRASRKWKSPSRIGPGVLEICQLADCVYLGLHGVDGEDGKIQATLDLLGVPYTGSDHLSSAMAMDKAVTKRIMEANGILTPRWQDLHYTAADIPRLAETLPVPCVIKVADGGSSIGVQIADTRGDLAEALADVLPYGEHVVVEEKIVGRELTMPVLDGRCLCPIEIVPPDEKGFDYMSKYQSGGKSAREICPAPVTEAERDQLAEAALKLHRALGLSVYSRSDFMLDREGRAWCLEVNTLPGMTSTSLIPQAAAEAGIGYGELCEKIVLLSIAERTKKN